MSAWGSGYFECDRHFRFAADTGRISVSPKRRGGSRTSVWQRLLAKRALCETKSYYYSRGFSGILKLAFLRLHLNFALEEDPLTPGVTADAAQAQQAGAVCLTPLKSSKAIYRELAVCPQCHR